MQDHIEEGQNDLPYIMKFKKEEIVTAIVLVKDWFMGQSIPFPFQPEDFVVCQWFDFNDGLKSNIEGKQTIAVLKIKKDALLLYKSYKT